ncbi:MAG TPA: hypothetical protein VGJ78_19560 [Vicinamibacterales bacterium]
MVLALVAGGASPWWWSELKRAWQPDAPPTATSAPAATSAPVAPASAASTASVTTSGLATETPAPAPRAESAAIRPRPEGTDQTSERTATVRPAARATPATAPVEPASGQPTTSQPNPEAYRAVQRIYERTKGVSDCAALADSIRNLQRYARGQRPVPEEFTQTVIYPKRMVQPTIGDLAMDRNARIKLASPSCFP